MHLSDDKSSRQFIIRYSQVESSPSKKKNRYSEKKQYIDIFQAQTQLNLPPKRIKSHRKHYQLLQTQANPTPRMKLVQSPKIQRNNSSSVDVYSHQNKSQMKQKIKKEQREYSKIPIQYYDERDYGNIADKVRGRVIYRGYAPKNTYYYLKTIKDLHFVQDTIRNLRGEDIAFNSKFQSGNLNTVVKVSPKQYWLFMRQDTNTHGLRQWYYFEVKVRKAIRLKFRLYKYSKPFSLYKDGMGPYVKTLLTQWRQQGQNVKYEFDNQIKCYYLEFQYQFQENTETYFATLPPYTYSMLMDYMKLLKEEDNIKIQNIGYSLSGLDIPSIAIKNSLVTKNQDYYHKKEAIFIMARTHPGQTNSNFALEGFIQKLLLDSYLLQKYDYYILPMVNPDGVFLGNHRTGVLGQDLNRNFNSQELQYFPQIEIIHRWITQIKKSQKISFMIDLHGHSAKKNIFAYGQEHQFGSNKYLYSRILPKILSNTIDTFKYDHCVFRACKQKKNTARVYFSKKYKINSITFEQSYGLIDVGPIGIHNWKNFGISLAQSLKTFCQITQKDPIHNMSQILKEQMRLQKIQIQKRNQKHKKMMSMHQKLTAQIKSQKRKTQNLEGLSSQLQKSFQMYISQIKSKQEKPQKLEILQEQQIKSNDDDNNSVKTQELSSGDQDMELTNNQLDDIKKDIVRVKGQKQIVKREIYNLADKKVQLKAAWGHHQQPRLHNDRSSMIPRILKLQMKKKQQYLAHNYIGGGSYQFKQKKVSVELPYLKR